MIEILHYLTNPKLRELWHKPQKGATVEPMLWVDCRLRAWVQLVNFQCHAGLLRARGLESAHGLGFRGLGFRV